MKKFTSLEDLVPRWLKLSAENDYKSIRDEEVVAIPDPAAPGTSPTVRPAVAYLYVNEKAADNQKSSDYVVGLYWKDMRGESDLFKKSYSSEGEASARFENLKSSLHKIHNLLDTSPNAAKEAAQDFFDKNRLTTDPNLDAVPSGGGSKTLTELAPGWEIVSSGNNLSVKFGFEFLKNAMKKFPVVLDLPVQKPDIVYNTAAKVHVGNDNYVVSRWKKTLTLEGNVLRNVVSIERESPTEQIQIICSSVPDDSFNKICSELTPHQDQYGLSYDSVTKKWTKTAKAVVQNLFFDTVDDLLKYQKEQKGGATTPPEKGLPKLDLDKLDKPADKEEKDELKDLIEKPEEGPASVSFDELMDKELGSPMESVDKLPGKTKPSLSSKDSELLKVSKQDPKSLEVGQEVVYVSEGTYTQGKVVNKTNKGVDLEVTTEENRSMAFPGGGVKGEVLKDLQEEGEHGEISYFLTPEEFRTFRTKTKRRNQDEGVEWEFKENPAEAPKEKTPKEEEEEELEQSQINDEDLGVEVSESSLRPLSSLDITSALKQWMDRPEWKELIDKNPWMQKLYENLLENFRSGPPLPEPGMPSGRADPMGKGPTEGLTVERGLPGLRTEVKALDAKKRRGEEFYQQSLETRKLIEHYDKETEKLQVDLEKEKDPTKRKKLEQDIAYQKKQKDQRTVSLENIKKRLDREWIDPEAFEQAIVGLFMKYLHLSTVPKELVHTKDPAQVATGSKKLRELLNREKAAWEKLKVAREGRFSLAEQIAGKEDQLWELFKSLPEPDEQSQMLAEIEGRIAKIDDLFANYLRYQTPTEEGIKKFQDTISKLEKERQGRLKDLPPETQSKADSMISEINSLQENLYEGSAWKELQNSLDELKKIEDEKYKLQDEIGVVATLKTFKE